MRPCADDGEAVSAQTVTERYESLRTAAFGERLPLEARGGLALFLRRGMWGWVRAATSPSIPVRVTCSRSSGSLVNEHQAAIQLFAAMAMSFTRRRQHEHVH